MDVGSRPGRHRANFLVARLRAYAPMRSVAPRHRIFALLFSSLHNSSRQMYKRPAFPPTRGNKWHVYFIVRYVKRYIYGRAAGPSVTSSFAVMTIRFERGTLVGIQAFAKCTRESRPLARVMTIKSEQG